MTITQGGSITSLPTPVYWTSTDESITGVTHPTFTGWYIVNSANNITTATKVTASTTFNESTTLRAKWSGLPPTINTTNISATEATFTGVSSATTNCIIPNTTADGSRKFTEINISSSETITNIYIPETVTTIYIETTFNSITKFKVSQNNNIYRSNSGGSLILKSNSILLNRSSGDYEGSSVLNLDSDDQSATAIKDDGSYRLFL